MESGNIDVAYFTETGPRDLNEDACKVEFMRDGSVVLAVADGLGGGPCGDKAARLAVDELVREIALSKQPDEVLSSIDQYIKDEAHRDRCCEGMATTLSYCKIMGGNVEFGHIGDTRITHIRGKGVLSRTKDQTEVQYLLDQGVLNRREAARYRRKNRILAALGRSWKISPHCGIFDVQKDDWILLTSDGVHQILKRQELRDFASSCDDAERLCAKLRQELETRGYVDNATVIACKIK